jgi:micrococcal nuclease
VLTAIGRKRGWLGSVLLLVVLGVLLLSDRGDRSGAPDRSSAPSVGGGEGSSQRAYVSRVIDGDTVEVRIDGASEDVRYIGIDTPETVKPGTPVQCFGPQAHEFNQRLVENRTVRLAFDRERRDVYGRLLAYVWLGGRMINAELVRRGYARTLTIPPNVAHAGLFHRLASAAGRAGRGLWGVC